MTGEKRKETYRTQNYCSCVLDRKSCGQSVDCVLVDTIGHVEHDDAHDSEVEEGSGPGGGLHHGQDDGDDQDDDLHQHGPHNSRSKIITEIIFF